MFTVALIGGDGAGKSTIAERLRKEFPFPIKYLYMGINIESSNVALPTSRLIERMKGKKYSVNGRTHNTSLHHQPQSQKKKSAVWRYIRMANRCAEEWYRQLLSRKYCQKGYIVLYDRHFLFDFAQPVNESEEEYKQRPLDDRLHRWLLHRYYPRPDLTIFLYAPPDVLYARKREASLEYLDNMQKAYMKEGEKIENFVTMDATKSLEEVYSDVTSCIMEFSKNFKGETA